MPSDKNDQLHHDRILILDFGAQYTQLIARRIREIGNAYAIEGEPGRIELERAAHAFDGNPGEARASDIDRQRDLARTRDCTPVEGSSGEGARIWS